MYSGCVSKEPNSLKSVLISHAKAGFKSLNIPFCFATKICNRKLQSFSNPLNFKSAKLIVKIYVLNSKTTEPSLKTQDRQNIGYF